MDNYFFLLLLFILWDNGGGRGYDIEVIGVNQKSLCFYLKWRLFLGAAMTKRKLVELVHVIDSLHGCNLPVVFVSFTWVFAWNFFLSIVHHHLQDLVSTHMTTGWQYGRPWLPSLTLVAANVYFFVESQALIHWIVTSWVEGAGCLIYGGSYDYRVCVGACP